MTSPRSSPPVRPPTIAPNRRRARARRGDGELLRDDIVAATARLLAETGDEEAVSIRSVADAVGVTPPSIYLHFADKADLMFAVCEERFAALERITSEAAHKATDPLDEIKRRGEAYIRFGLDNPEHYRILFMGRDDGAQYDEARLKVSACFGDLVVAVDAAMAAGLLDVDDPFLVATGLWVGVHGVTSLMIAKPQFPWPPFRQITDHLMGVALAGLARGSSASTAPSTTRRAPRRLAARPEGTTSTARSAVALGDRLDG